MLKTSGVFHLINLISAVLSATCWHRYVCTVENGMELVFNLIWSDTQPSSACLLQTWTGSSRGIETCIVLIFYHSTYLHCPAVLSCLPHSDCLSGRHHCEVWDLGHGGSRALPQPGSNVLQRSTGGHCGLRHYQHSRFQPRGNNGGQSLINQ